MTTNLPSPSQPLTGQQWVEAIELIEDLWPGTKTWHNADRQFELFRNYTTDLVDRAIRTLFNEGRQSAPSPSTLAGKIRAIAGENGIGITERGYDGPHVHAFGHTPPAQRWHNRYATHIGPGELACVRGCDQTRNCHCVDCKADPYYHPGGRPLSADEMSGLRAMPTDHVPYFGAVPDRENATNNERNAS